MKIVWVDTERRFCLSAREVIRFDNADDEFNFVTEEQMQEVSKWCNENHCGRRISYDMVQFKNKKEMSMFLLKWG